MGVRRRHTDNKNIGNPKSGLRVIHLRRNFCANCPLPLSDDGSLSLDVANFHLTAANCANLHKTISKLQHLHSPWTRLVSFNFSTIHHCISLLFLLHSRIVHWKIPNAKTDLRKISSFSLKPKLLQRQSNRDQWKFHQHHLSSLRLPCTFCTCSLQIFWLSSKFIGSYTAARSNSYFPTAEKRNTIMQK